MSRIGTPIDGLAHSIIDTRTGRSRATVIRPWGELLAGEFAKTADWEFNWFKETREAGREIFGLTLRRSDVIEGLASLSFESAHVELQLLESAPHNRGKSKRFQAVPGNLVAFACWLSISAGFKGNLAFDSKTQLVNHYEETLGAKRIGSGTRMLIDEPAARRLIDLTHGKKDQWPAQID